METTTVNENLIVHLNNLIEINNDRIEGYERAANETEDFDLKHLFTSMAAHSRSLKGELSTEVTALGGTPSEGTKNSGKIFRVWMDIKAALSGKDRKTILSSCEFGEDAALETYDDELKYDDVMESSIRALITRQRSALQQDHDRVKSLRDAQR